MLFEREYALDPVDTGYPNYDVSPDGRRFLMMKPGGTDESATITVVLNWFEELKRLVPAK